MAESVRTNAEEENRSKLNRSIPWIIAAVAVFLVLIAISSSRNRVVEPVDVRTDRSVPTGN